ncbi:hypothetical protein DFH08DRAFT_130961 [Mycena albidolilacea]|uniref:TLC domain-containing protein n=1 Tax=Mycena albidolilacea TaxID=1033008 RepID=A0AAD7ETF0_9AGAR|nr:hypothetical protein DFH08DRAFT_130961 [Mycena albidolilacea]
MHYASGLFTVTSASILYHALQHLYTTQRQRAWIITGASSTVMTLCSAPFVIDLVWSGGDVTAVHPRFQLAALTCKAFQGSLLADLIVGSIYYRSSITVGWGWIHHSTYIILVELILRRQWAHLFCLALVMEFPTSYLALSFLYPRVRRDWLFCASFLTTRIFFHLFLLYIACSPGGRSAVQGSYLPALFLALALPGHATWFIQSVRGAVRRGLQQSGQSPTTPQDEKQQQSDITAFLLTAMRPVTTLVTHSGITG